MVGPARQGEAAAAASDPVFQVAHMSLAYPARRGQPAVPILTDVSLEVDRGTSLTLVGPSGSGKSTLLRCLNRLAEPTGGCVRFHGRDITSLDPLELRRRAALVLQTPVLFEGTVRDNLRMQPSTARADLSEARARPYGGGTRPRIPRPGRRDAVRRREAACDHFPCAAGRSRSAAARRADGGAGPSERGAAGGHNHRAPAVAPAHDRRRHASTGADPPAWWLPALSGEGRGPSVRVYRRPHAHHYRCSAAGVSRG